MDFVSIYNVNNSISPPQAKIYPFCLISPQNFFSDGEGAPWGEQPQRYVGSIALSPPILGNPMEGWSIFFEIAKFLFLLFLTALQLLRRRKLSAHPNYDPFLAFRKKRFLAPFRCLSKYRIFNLIPIKVRTF